MWSLVRLLRKLEAAMEHPGASEALKRVRFDATAHCAALSQLVRNRGAGPVDKPGPLSQRSDAAQTTAELWRLLQGAFEDLKTRAGELAQGAQSPAERDVLAGIAKNLDENQRWLAALMP